MWCIDKTIEYKYNGIGNLLSVTVNGTTTQFGYSSAHLDRLTSYGGQAITYDAIGCPVRYGNKLLTWNKGKLVKICDDVDENSSESSESVEFTYNAYGQRVSKVYEYNPGPDYSGDFLIGSTTTYDYDHSGRLIHEACEQDFTESASVTDEFIYLYDESGIIGCAYYVNGSLNGKYYYQRNLLGDVVGIYNTSGTKVVGYAYDAFGNCTTTLGANNEFSKINHFRYRGYYLDRETGLYYLNARYYNPEWRRFISPANVSSLNPKAVNGLNLYAYADNQSIVKFTDKIQFSTTASITAANSPTLLTNDYHRNYLNIHWEQNWMDTDWPGFLVLSKEGFEVINWGLSIYKTSLFLDNDEYHSMYVSTGNINIYAGINYKKGIGIDASANVLEIGYDGRIIDASIEGLTIGLTYMYKDGTFKFGVGYGWLGWSISIDLVEIYIILCGGA